MREETKTFAVPLPVVVQFEVELSRFGMIAGKDAVFFEVPSQAVHLPQVVSPVTLVDEVVPEPTCSVIDG